MNGEWKVFFKVFRLNEGSQKGHYDTFEISIHPDEYVLDGIEKVWAFHDRSLVYRHACHHSTCGACGMRVNYKEKLTCITTIRSVTHDGGTIVVEPLRNMPVISDLAVDMGQFFRVLDAVDYNQVQPVTSLPVSNGIKPQVEERSGSMDRLVDCLECGLCISACPASATSAGYYGPAALAAIQSRAVDDKEYLQMADHADGIWRCHSAYECTEVCPSNFEPGWRIMDLRKMTVSARLHDLFEKKDRKETL